MKFLKGLCSGDYILLALAAVLGVTEGVQLAALLLGLSLSACVGLWVPAVLAVLAADIGLWLWGSGKISNKNNNKNNYNRRKSNRNKRPVTRAAAAAYLIFALLLLSQLLYLVLVGGEYREGDITVETVNSFLETDGVYRVNPLTGMLYTQGLPARWKILCLPLLYAILGRLTGLAPWLLVRRVVPAAVLLCSYTAYGILAKSLFPGEGENAPRAGVRRACFLIGVALLLWAGNYGYGMEGFDVLSCGYRGVALRSSVLLPWLFSLCLRKKWGFALLCILAEACIVWTFYGAGVCAAVTVGMAAAGALAGHWKKREAAE